MGIFDNYKEINGQILDTGWMLEPEGKIRNTTPFGGWVK